MSWFNFPDLSGKVNCVSVSVSVSTSVSVSALQCSDDVKIKKCHWVSHCLNDWLGHPLSCPGQLKMDSGTSPRQLTRWQKKQSSAKMRCGQDKILTFAKDDINMMFLVSQFKIAGEGSVQSIQRGLSNGNNWWVQIQRGVYTYLSIKHWGLILYSYDFQVYQSLFPLGESAKYAHLVFKTIDKDNTGSSFF